MLTGFLLHLIGELTLSVFFGFNMRDFSPALLGPRQFLDSTIRDIFSGELFDPDRPFCHLLF